MSANVMVRVNGSSVVGAGMEESGTVSISSHELGHLFENEEEGTSESESENENGSHQSSCSSSTVCAVDLEEERRPVVGEGCGMQSMKGIFSAPRAFLVEVETVTARGVCCQLYLSFCEAVAIVSVSARPCGYSCVLFLAPCRGRPDLATGWI